MTDNLAEDFMKPVHDREAKIGVLDALITEKKNELAALESECAVARKAMSDLADERSNLQGAVNANRALLTKTQTDLANCQAMFETLRRKVQSLPITTRAAS